MAPTGDQIKLRINGVQYSVGSEVRSDLTLLDYIRINVGLRGTKYMCREAGCGACIVSVSKYPGAPVQSVNACVISVLSCNGWEITTVEKVGNKKDGYHVLQRTLAKMNGTQCGHCSPGWIMAMYSLLREKKVLTMREIEQSFGSNICRCTGYRPILDAFKRFAKDSPNLITDIEDLKICDKNGTVCSQDTCLDSDWCMISDINLNPVTRIKLKDGKIWFIVYEIKDIFLALTTEGIDSYMLVAGNTAKVPYPIDEYPRVLIDIDDVQELKGSKMDQNLMVGAGSTLTELLDIFKTMSSCDGFEYLSTLYDHLQLVAHIPVRNIGTIAGNLMVKHQHNEFPSDIYLMFATVGAQITVCNILGRETLSMRSFLNTSMKGKVILNVLFPPLSDAHKIVTFKIMGRSQSVHAIVNAGFLYKLDNDNKVQKARIVYGNLSPNFNRASLTEKFLCGKNLFTNDTLQDSLKVLVNELVVMENPPEASAAFRKALACRLYYKGLLSLCPKTALHPRYASGAIKLRETRPVSTAQQVYDTDTSIWPLTQPLEKVEALIQCSGEAKYTEDLPAYPNEVFGAFVLSTVASGNIVNIDASEALKYPGVIAFYTAKDIPGLNSFTPNDVIFYTAYEEVLSSGRISFHNQPIGIIVADAQQVANRATKLVKVTYGNLKRPVVDFEEARKDQSRNTLYTTVKAQDRGANIDKVIKNKAGVYGQYHFPMETLACVAIPTEEGLEVHSTAQWMAAAQRMIARALNLQENKIDMHVRRIGGGFGYKISRNIQCAVACSIVAFKLNRPCRFIQPLTTNIKAMGKRLPTVADFEVGVNSVGAIQFLNMATYQDNGYMLNEDFYSLSLDSIYNCYDNRRWTYSAFNTITDTPKNTWCRAPGTLENIAITELMMEQIAYELSQDPLEVRLANLDNTRYNDLREIVETLKTTSQYNERRVIVDNFNAANRWKKRGLRFSLMRWTPISAGTFKAIMSVYHGDGTISITYDGIEMGQGINTKSVQIAAFMLNIPVEKIQIKAASTIVLPNGFVSAASVTTQNIGVCVRNCCIELLRRLQPIRDSMNNPPWEQLVKAAFDANVDLQTTGSFNANDFENYNVFGAALAEVEVDMLTGESVVLRADLLEDVGRSVNPELDVGQVEGAFIMGQGVWTSEHLVYDHNTGEVLTDRAWNYHVLLAQDIPLDFRVDFRKSSMGTPSAFGAKCIGEPPICMAVVVPIAIREALAAGRFECGIPTTQWFQIGHTYMECDNMHFTIERASEYVKIYIPDDWQNVLRLARKDNPYSVQVMEHTDFLDFKGICSNIFPNKIKATDGTVLHWANLRWLRLNRDFPNSLLFKFHYCEEFNEVKLKERVTRSERNSCLAKLYSKQILLKKEKHTDLIDMCKDGTIPKHLRSYYENLPVVSAQAAFRSNDELELSAIRAAYLKRRSGNKN